MKIINFAGNKKFIVILLLVIMIISACYGLNVYNVFAEDGYTGVYMGIANDYANTQELYNATNTFNYNGFNTKQVRTYEYFNTSESGRNNNTVSTGAPLLTVLTHGLGSGASVWSNDNVNNIFACDANSLFSELKNLLMQGNSDAYIYWAKMQSGTQFKLIDLQNNINISNNINTSVANGGYLIKETKSSITDITKHIIIIFEATANASRGYNYEVYEEFNYMLSKIVYDVKQLNGGVLPKINLIGHSRGGITNLMYALDHPEMVASMFSIGTPYFGSDTANTEIGKSIGGDGNGLTDIIDSTIYNSYFNRWRNDYSRLYSNIQAYALGGFSDTDFLFDTLIDSDNQSIENIVSDSDLCIIKNIIKTIPPFITDKVGKSEEIARWLTDILGVSDENIKEALVELLADISYIDTDSTSDSFNKFRDNVYHNFPGLGCPYYLNDLLVDLDSQLAKDKNNNSYSDYGFNLYAKCFKQKDFYLNQTEKRSEPNQPAVVHNLEARDYDFISYILSKIDLGQQHAGYIYKQTSSSSTDITLIGYRGTLLDGDIVIPSQVNGFTVDAISYDLFKGVGKGITKITIPSTVEIIERGAFIGLTSLTDVVFEQGSVLTNIGSEAFSKCYNLENIEIPRYVHTIENDAFLRCNNLNLTVNSNNTAYSMLNGVLFNKAGTKLIMYPSNKTDTSYTIPATVAEIGGYAFYNNKNLTELHIEGRPTIRPFAFCNLTNLQTIRFYTEIPPSVEIGAFDNTTFSMYVPDGCEEAYYDALGAYADNVDAAYPIQYQLKLVCSITDEKIMYADAYYLGLVTLTYVPTKEHYEFEGVYSQPDGQGIKYVQKASELNSYNHQIQWESTSAIWEQRASGTLYINWTRISGAVSCNAVANNSIISKPTVQLTSGVASTITAPSISGYNFSSWSVAGASYTTATITVNVTLHRSYNTGNITLVGTEHPTQDAYITIYYTEAPAEECVAEGTLITLADGRQVPVEQLTGNERLLVWNLKTGRFDSAPILFIDSEEAKVYDIINLYFSDGTHVKVISEHAFWDFDLNKYVYLREDASKYIGHYFNKQVTDKHGKMAWEKVQLTDVSITKEYTTAWSPVTEKHLCLYVNGMLSMPGGIEGLINTFEVNGRTMKIDRAKYRKDIKTYGVYTYEEFYELYPVPQEMFEAVDGQYLKVAIGKGLLTHEELTYLIQRYSKFFE